MLRLFWTSSLWGPIVVGLGRVALVDRQAFEQAVNIAPVNASFPAQNLLCHAAGTHSDAFALQVLPP
jgi:hypothetical protein